MPYIIDSESGQLVWSGTNVPSTSYQDIVRILAQLNSSLSALSSAAVTSASTFSTNHAILTSTGVSKAAVESAASVDGSGNISAFSLTAGNDSSTGFVNFRDVTGFSSILGPSEATITEDRIVLIPDASGTLAIIKGTIVAPIVDGGDNGLTISRQASANPWSHGFSDETQYTIGFSGGAYNSYDSLAYVGTGGTGTYDHTACFQARNRFSGGTLATWYGLVTIPAMTAGVTQELQHIRLNPPSLSGGATVVTQYGILIPELAVAGTTYAVAFASNGPNTHSWHNGSLAVGSNFFADSCAQFEVKSTTKGFLLPRMTKTQRNAIASPVAGLAVYQTDATPGLRVYNGTNWMKYSESTD